MPRCQASINLALHDPENGYHTEHLYFERTYWCELRDGHDGDHEYRYSTDTDPVVGIDRDRALITWPAISDALLDRKLPEGRTTHDSAARIAAQKAARERREKE